jgi:hypothetical protein
LVAANNGKGTVLTVLADKELDNRNVYISYIVRQNLIVIIGSIVTVYLCSIESISIYRPGLLVFG